MKFRPCIDIHNGKVKQIVGGDLQDAKVEVTTNYTSKKDASWYAKLYRRDQLTGGHIIILNHQSSPYYEASKQQAMEALEAYPKGLQIGGGITADNANEYLKRGASHVIVTSYVFSEGVLRYDHLQKLISEVGKEQIVLDLSCRKKDKDYYIVTNRWQCYTNSKVSLETMERLSEYCGEFLIHGVDVEGKKCGIEEELVEMLGEWNGIPVTYAGGIGSLADIEHFRRLSKGKIDFTIGSALDLFGGFLPYDFVRNV